MIKSNISSEESILHNLDTWCCEVGSRFEQVSIDAAYECINLINDLGLDYSVVDLGCGDGAATKVFLENDFNVIGVDINDKKLDKFSGPKIQTDMLSFVKFFNKINNVFTHHALEHSIDAEEIINTIGQKMSIGSIYYAVVPANDHLHSVHHIVFESPKELLPPGLIPLKMEYQERNEPEFICIAQKLL